MQCTINIYTCLNHLGGGRALTTLTVRKKEMDNSFIAEKDFFADRKSINNERTTNNEQ